MKTLEEEIRYFYLQFKTEFKPSIEKSYIKLEEKDEEFFSSYKNIASLNGWKSSVFKNIYNINTLNFFIESQNDMLMSHMCARLGSWRLALMSLRSCIDNTLFFLYYMDHPIELKLWENGKHQITFTDLFTYIESHPGNTMLDPSINGKRILKNEYSTLSKAVHGSAANFRMTGIAGFPTLSTPSFPDLMKWRARQTEVIKGINLVYL